MEPNSDKSAISKSESSTNGITHPLQEILTTNYSALEEEPAVENDHASENISGKLNSNVNKSNWVKFDDEVNSGHEKNNNAEHVAATTIGRISQNEHHIEVSPSYLSLPQAPLADATTRDSETISPLQRTTLSSPSNVDVAPAVLNTEITHVNLNVSGTRIATPTQQTQQSSQKSKGISSGSVPPRTGTSTINQQLHNKHEISTSVNVPMPSDTAPGMRTIELSTGSIREGFANGDIIVTLLPANTKWPWVTPAIFRPELVPEELMAQGLTLTVEDYVHVMETLVNDYRFTIYNICYKRILICWILFAFSVLLILLFSGLQGVALFSLGVGWLFLNAAAIFLCMWVKLRLSRGLEKCLARVNKQLLKHKILLVLDDRGRISCHKVNLCFMYFDSTQCVNFLNEFLEQTEQNGGEKIKAGWEKKLDIDLEDIVIQGSNPVRLSRKQAVAQELFLTYLQRWGKDYLRRRLDWIVQEAGVHETPRHLQSSLCPCQYEEEVLRNKIKTHLKGNQCCGINCIGCWL